MGLHPQTFSALEDELEKIAESDLPKGSLWSHLSPSQKVAVGALAAGTVGGHVANLGLMGRYALTNKAPPLAVPATALASTAGLLALNKHYGKQLVKKHREGRSKTASVKATAIGTALGSGAGLIKGLARENNIRAYEEGRAPPEQLAAMRQKRRKHLVGSVVLGGIAGGAAGGLGAKAFRGAKAGAKEIGAEAGRSAGKEIYNEVESAAKAGADRLGKHISGAPKRMAQRIGSKLNPKNWIKRNP